MDEDEELYREMDEDDGYYMGDRDEDEDNAPNWESSDCLRQNNAGCLLLPFVILLMTLAVVLVM